MMNDLITHLKILFSLLNEDKRFSKLTLSNPDLRCLSCKIKYFKNKDIIFPHEETIKDNHITNDIIKNSVIVLGVTFEYK